MNTLKIMLVTDTIFGRWELAVIDYVYIRNESGSNIDVQICNTYKHVYNIYIYQYIYLLRPSYTYSAAQMENAKSMSYQGLSQRGINEKSVCIRGRSTKQHGHDGQNAMSSRVHHGL